MDQKQNDKQVLDPAPQKEAPKKSSNKTLWWILGGCLTLIVIIMLALGGVAYWSYKKVKNEIKNKQPKFEEFQGQMEKVEKEAEKQNVPAENNYSEEPPVQTNTNEDGEFISSSERQMGYVKKVHMSGGKNYLDIDYIQWFMGDAAEKAMREDGECPKTGECEVLDDYYIRNANPLVRTFEISPDAVITMQTYNMEATGQIQSQVISINQFSQIWNTAAKPGLKSVPYIVEIENKIITNITEQYVP
jgi:hypothetical protein